MFNFNWELIFLLGGVLFVAFISYFAIKGSVEEKEKFLSECMTEHKEYECLSMWRSGDKEVVPVFFPIPMGK